MEDEFKIFFNQGTHDNTTFRYLQHVKYHKAKQPKSSLQWRKSSHTLINTLTSHQIQQLQVSDLSTQSLVPYQKESFAHSDDVESSIWSVYLVRAVARTSNPTLGRRRQEFKVTLPTLEGSKPTRTKRDPISKGVKK